MTTDKMEQNEKEGAISTFFWYLSIFTIGILSEEQMAAHL